MNYDDSLEDELYDAEVVTIMDDEIEAREIAAKRNASGISKEQIRIMDAANDGRRAGLWGNGASLNPHTKGSPEYDAWEKARSHAIGSRLNGNAMRRLP